MSHLVNGKVFPLFERLATLITNVVPLLWKHTDDRLKCTKHKREGRKAESSG